MASAQLILVCHAATAATRLSRFPADEGLDANGRAAAAVVAVRRVDRAWCSPARRARETAAAMGLDAAIDPALRDLHVGRWAGRSLDEVAAAEPAGVAAWLADGAAVPHGGESVAALRARVGAWLALPRVREGRVVAVTHPAVMRAAVLVALEAPLAGFWRVDVSPLGTVRMGFAAGRWTLRAIERAPRCAAPPARP